MILRARTADWEHEIQIAAWLNPTQFDRHPRPLKAVFTSEKGEEGQIVEPILRLKPSEAQQLFDELYRCGLRPSEKSRTEGVVEAMRYHLEDMRKLVFERAKQ